MKQVFLLVLFSSIIQSAFCQVELSGVIKDNGTPVPFVSVVLKDSSQAIAGYDISDEQGQFSISVEKGNYLLEITILGYKDWTKEIVLNEDMVMEDITMSSSTQDLKEVVVKYKKPLIERKPDKLVFNVENSPATSGGNALDALRVAPGVNVEADAISMLGRGASRIMIDGRILQLSGEALVDFLNSIAADDIKKIEVISNPPAKYEAAGSGGLINIVYKKGVGDFWKNASTVAYNQNKFNFITFRNNFMYGKDKIKLGISLNGDFGNVRQLENSITDYPSGPWESNLDVKQEKQNLSSRFSFDYDLTDRTTIGAQYLGSFSQPDRTDRALTNIFNTSNGLDSLFDSSGSNDRTVNSHLLNAHLISKFKSDGQISFDFDYFDYSNDLERNFLVNTFSSNNKFLGINQSLVNLSDQSIENVSAKVDVEHLAFKSINISYGAKLSFIKTINDLQTFGSSDEGLVFDPGLSNEFEYEENIQAIYLNGSKKINDYLELQVGLRFENTLTEGFSRTLNQTNENDYTQLFPTFYVSYSKNDNHSLAFNYGKRISRPSFRDLNPFRFFSNSNSYSEGNPFLQPSFTDNFEFSHTFKRVLNTNLFFTITSNGFGTVFSGDGENNILAIIRQNYYTRYVGGISEIYTFNKFDWWVSQTSVNLLGYRANIDDNVDLNPRNGLRFYFDTYNTFSLNGTTKLQIDFFYSSPYDNGLFSFGERYGLDIGLKKSFFEKDLQVALFVQDIFDSGSLNNLVSDVNGVEVDFSSNYSRRFFRASLSYNFGNSKLNVRQRNFGNNEERRRAN